LALTQREKLVDLQHHVMHRVRKLVQLKSLAQVVPHKVVDQLVADLVAPVQFRVLQLAAATCQLQQR
jgi:hypothetical protein